MTTTQADGDAFVSRALTRSLKRSEQIARDIVRTLRARELTAGTPLPAEALMVQHYGVGRGTLREALRILEVYGLITIKTGPAGGPRLGEVGGAAFARTATFYYATTGCTYRELAHARLAIEPFVAELAAERRTEADIAVLEDLLARARTVTYADEFVRLSLEFHSNIARIGGNSVLALIGSSFEEIFATYSINMLSMEENRQVIRVHERIAEAVIAGDAARAGATMRQHMEDFLRDFEARNADLMDRTVDWI